MSPFEAFSVCGALTLCLLFVIGILVWAWVLAIRAELRADQMRDALTLGTDAAPLGGFDAYVYPGLAAVSDAEWDAFARALNPDRELEVPPDATTEVL